MTYDTRTTFRQLRARATLAAVTQFRHAYYGRPVRPADRRVPLTWAGVPDDYAEQIRALRRARGLSQAQLATLVGAARKAVVYQGAARKRTPQVQRAALIGAVNNAVGYQWEARRRVPFPSVRGRIAERERVSKVRTSSIVGLGCGATPHQP